MTECDWDVRASNGSDGRGCGLGGWGGETLVLSLPELEASLFPDLAAKADALAVGTPRKSWTRLKTMDEKIPQF